MRKCLISGSEEVFLWLGGPIGDLYHCADCDHIGPVVIEDDGQEPFGGQFVSFWDRLEEGSFWSETGIASHMLFQT